VVQARPGDPGRPDAPALGRLGGTVAGRYRLDERRPTDLPSAERWTATDQILARPVVVTLVSGSRTAAVLDAARRAALVVEPRLARILDVGQADGTGYVVTAAVEGRSLASLAGRAPLPADQARAVVGEAAAALEAARRRGVHHLALRPDALVLTAAGRVVLEGLAVDGEIVGASGGTAHAMSRADAVGLVRVLYAALTGRWPSVAASGPGALPSFAEWSAGSAAPARAAVELDAGLPLAPEHDGAPLPPVDLVPGVPADLDTLCAVTLGPHDDGPHSPGELVRELEPWRAVRADEIFRAADAGRWPALPGQAPAGATTPGAGTGPGSGPGIGPGTTTAPPTGSSPMTDDQKRAADDTTTPAQGGSAAAAGAGAAGAGAAAGAAAGAGAAGAGAGAGAAGQAGAGAAAGAAAAAGSAAAAGAAGAVARQSVRSAFGAGTPSAGARRPGTPPPAIPPASQPAAIPPAGRGPVRTSTRGTAAVPAARPAEGADAGSAGTPASSGASTPTAATTPATPAAPAPSAPASADPTPTAPAAPAAPAPSAPASADPTPTTPATSPTPPATSPTPSATTATPAAPAAPPAVPPARSGSPAEPAPATKPTEPAAPAADPAAERERSTAREDAPREPDAADLAVAGITGVGAAAEPAATPAPDRADPAPTPAPGPDAAPVRRTSSVFGRSTGRGAAAGATAAAAAASTPATGTPDSTTPTPAPAAPAAGRRPSAPEAAEPPVFPPFGADAAPADAPADAPEATPADRPAWDLPFPAEERAVPVSQRRIDPTRWVLGGVALAVIIGVVIAIGNVLSPFRSPGDAGTEAAPAPATSAPAAEAPAEEGEAPAEEQPAATVPPVIAAVNSIDPSDGDGEHEELVGRLTDGDPATAWYTHTYNRPDYAGFKDAVGLVITLQEPATVTAITLDVNGSGGAVEVRSTDAANPTAGDVLASGALAPQTVLTLAQPTETQSIVLWFPSLAQTPDGQNRIEISNLAVS
jgi:hypothetical protein